VSYWFLHGGVKGRLIEGGNMVNRNVHYSRVKLKEPRRPMVERDRGKQYGVYALAIPLAYSGHMFHIVGFAH
jgi:hypothetical protein